MVVRPATKADVPALAALATELGYPATAAETGARLESLIAQGGEHRVWVAEADGRVIGFLHAYVARHLVSDPHAEIGGLVVADGARGQGVGVRLLEAVHAWARERGFDRVGVHSNVLRADAHRFYEREGYVLEKRQGVLVRRLERP